MTEDFTTEAFQYLLDELDPERRAAFETQLAGDPEARELLKICADSVAQFACESAPSEEMSRIAQRTTFDAVLAEIGEEKPTPIPRAYVRQKSWKHALWPIAALLLLSLNLLQFSQRAHPPMKNEKDSKSAETVEFVPRTKERIHQIPPIGQSAGVDPGRATVPPGGTENEPTEGLKRLQKLKAEYADLERTQSALRSEYDSIMRQFAERASTGKSVGRLTSMELVDPGSFARGERKGLVDLARGLLTEPGIVAVEPVTPLVDAIENFDPTPIPPPLSITGQPEVTSSSVGKSGISNPVTIDASGVLSNTVQGPGNTALPTASTTIPPSSLPADPKTTLPASPESPALPYAWAVFDETEGRGHLNLYNLPTVPAGQALQLWTKTAKGGNYQLIGEVPAQYYGRSGSIYYTPPGTPLAPVEVLITQEPRSSQPTRPSGPVVLRGP